MQVGALKKLLSSCIILIIFMAGCVKGAPGAVLHPVTSPSPVLPTTGPEEWYSVYFTDSDRSTTGQFSGGPVADLAQAINQARLSVDVAVYDLDLLSINKALINAQRRGVVVRVVTESDNLDSPETQIPAIQEAGIEVIADRRESLMHHKFTVIDRMEVWTGSMNYTASDGYHNDNNLIRIRSTELAEIYTKEFNKMFEQDLFGDARRTSNHSKSVNINGTEIEAYFSPEDGIASKIVELIDNAQESIDFLAYSFSAGDISEAMIARAQAGVTLAGVFDKTQAAATESSSAYFVLQSAGLDVRLDSSPQNMHDKIILIDGRIVITGSYNFSAAAENQNDENILIIHNTDIAGLYQQDFWRIYERAKK